MCLDGIGDDMREMKNSDIEWIGDIPSNWSITKCKYISYFVNGYAFDSKELDSSFKYPVIRIGDIKNGSIDFVECQGVQQNDGLEIYKILHNDILLAMSGATVGKIGLAINPPCSYINQRVGIIRSSYYKYLFYCLSTNKFVEYILLEASGSAQPNVSGFVYGNYQIPFPSENEINRITDYLDCKCAEIDAVIEKTKATIEEYKKLKQSVITEAVTKGIRGDRLMKDSGIEWIGKIPADWDVVRIKNLFDYRNERNFKPLEEVNLISLYTDLGVVQHCDLEETTGNKASNADGYKLVYEDDIVINIILCWMGAIGRSAYNGVTSPAYDVYSPKEGTNTKFYHHLFRTQGFNGDCYKVGRGIMAMRWRTYSDQFRAIKVVSPPPEEQEEIVKYLDKKCAEIDTLIAKKTTLLEEMENYKKSVIYEYVTGKKEVK